MNFLCLIFFLSRVELKKIVLTELEIFFNPVCYELWTFFPSSLVDFGQTSSLPLHDFTMLFSFFVSSVWIRISIFSALMLLKFVCWVGRGVVEKKWSNFWGFSFIIVYWVVWISACLNFIWNLCRVQGSLQFWKALLAVTFCLEDQVWLFILIFPQMINYGLAHFVFWCEWIVGIVTRRPLVLQLHKMESETQEYAEFLHLPRRKFTDFGTKVPSIHIP